MCARAPATMAVQDNAALPGVRGELAAIGEYSNDAIFSRKFDGTINREPDLVVCGEAENAREALAAVEKLKQDLVLADITLPGRNGLELIRDIRAIQPKLPVLVLSMHDASVFAERVLRAGGRGYISKQRSGQRLMQPFVTF